jgi:hypothetical protein
LNKNEIGIEKRLFIIGIIIIFVGSLGVEILIDILFFTGLLNFENNFTYFLFIITLLILSMDFNLIFVKVKTFLRRI